MHGAGGFPPCVRWAHPRSPFSPPPGCRGLPRARHDAAVSDSWHRLLRPRPHARVVHGHRGAERERLLHGVARPGRLRGLVGRRPLLRPESFLSACLARMAAGSAPATVPVQLAKRGTRSTGAARSPSVGAITRPWCPIRWTRASSGSRRALAPGVSDTRTRVLQVHKGCSALTRTCPPPVSLTGAGIETEPTGGSRHDRNSSSVSQSPGYGRRPA
jgi:hypothetical protein